MLVGIIFRTMGPLTDNCTIQAVVFDGCVLFFGFSGSILNVDIEPALKMYSTVVAFRHGFDSNLLLPPSGALVYCSLIPCVFLLKEAYST